MWIINDWNAVYENGDSRRYKKLTRFVAVPNRHDGRGFKRLSKRPGGLEAFGCFILMVQIASRMPVRGALMGPDGPLRALDLEDMTGYPKEAFEAALVLLSSPEIAWISDVGTLPDDFHSSERTTLTTRAVPLSRAASIESDLPVENLSAQKHHKSAQKRYQSAQTCAETPQICAETVPNRAKNFTQYSTEQYSTREQTDSQSASERNAQEQRDPMESNPYTPPDPEEQFPELPNEQPVTEPDSDREASSESEVTPASLARLVAESDEGLGPVVPSKSRRASTHKPTRNEITRMAQVFQQYAEHLTSRKWPLPDWPMASKACLLTNGRYAEAENLLRESALAKRPDRSGQPIEIRTYGLVYTILETHFKR